MKKWYNICKKSCWICKECSFQKNMGVFFRRKTSSRSQSSLHLIVWRSNGLYKSIIDYLSVFVGAFTLYRFLFPRNFPGLKWWTSFTFAQFFLASLGKEKKQQMLESCKQFTLFPIIVMVRNFTLIWRKLILETSHFPLPRSTRTVDKAPGQQTHSVSCWQPIWRRKNPDFQWSERIKLLEN